MAKKVMLPGESATGHAASVAQIAATLEACDAAAFAACEHALRSDTRKGVRAALERAERRLAAARAEEERVAGLYAFERTLAAERGATVWVGLDEVGRGPVAGPLVAGAVVLDPDAPIAGLNDSKQVLPEAREDIAAAVRERALAWAVSFVDNEYIDAHGMTAALRRAFGEALADVERMLAARGGERAGLVLLDGNPLHFDAREVSVVKGDAKCASIAAASLVAKVARDAYMVEQARAYPQYGWDANKGYASKQHIDAIAAFGLTPLHRASFCTSFAQMTLF